MQRISVGGDSRTTAMTPDTAAKARSILTMAALLRHAERFARVGACTNSLNFAASNHPPGLCYGTPAAVVYLPTPTASSREHQRAAQQPARWPSAGDAVAADD
jgi:hypothetical protein